MLTNLHSKLRGRPVLTSVVSNTGWLLGDRILRLGVGLVVSIGIARYLGPNQFGLWNFTLAIGSLFGVFSTLGLDNIVVRDLVRAPGDVNEILGTAALMRLAGSVIAMAGTIATVWLVGRDQPGAILLALAVGIVSLGRVADIVDLRFQSEIQSKRTVLARSLGFTVASVGKVVLAVAGAGVVMIAAAETAGAAVAAVALFAMYAAAGHRVGEWRWSGRRAKSLLRDAWPQILSTAAIMVYMRIDQVMLQEMAGAKEVGVYSAAVRFSEVWYFIPAALVSSVFPVVIRLRDVNPEAYYHRLQQLFSIMTLMALAVAVPMTLAAKPLLNTLYGEHYHGAGAVLAVHVWIAVFVFWGVAQEPWNLAEGLQRLTFYRTLAGAALNILLNLALIPRHGAVGSAVATLISQACVACFSNLMYNPTRRIFVMQMRSLALYDLRRSIGLALARRSTTSAGDT